MDGDESYIIRRSGRVKEATVEFGGFIDIGDKLVAVAFKKIRTQNGNVALDITEAQLEKASE